MKRVVAVVVFCVCVFGVAGVMRAQTLEERKQLIEAHDNAPASQEALDRRARSDAELQKENVPLNAKLPVIADSKSAQQRTKEEIADRAIALCLVSMKATGADGEMMDSLVKKYGAEKFFSPDEEAFMKEKEPAMKEKIAFSWRSEDYWVMLWALGYVEKLDYPKAECDLQKAAAFLLTSGSTDEFIGHAKLRTIGEILDQADLIYQYHWATDDARANGRDVPTGLSSDVVMERHYALNWLIGYMKQAWDHITTDT